MWEYVCENTKTGEEELYFGYNFTDATKRCDHVEDLKVVGQNYVKEKLGNGVAAVFTRKRAEHG